jgi:hypothetical protein
MKTNKKKEKLVTQENPVIDLKGEKCKDYTGEPSD